MNNSRNPINCFTLVRVNATGVLVHPQDDAPETAERLRAHVLPDDVPVFYYLRGLRFFGAHTDMLLGRQHVAELPPALFEIVHCLAFWNQEGRKMYELNGEPGESYQDFVRRMIYSDCRVFTKPTEGAYTAGRDAAVVWVDDAAGQRLLTISF